jgi:DNA-binding winged helix-turn-helix (wHTH) protein
VPDTYQEVSDVSTATRFRIGPFRLNVETGELLHAGRITKRTLKTTQALLTLAQRTGELVSKQELFRTVWNGLVVSDAALTSGG